MFYVCNIYLNNNNNKPENSTLFFLAGKTLLKIKLDFIMEHTFLCI